MHINRKPGEIMEVDWAGQTAKLIDTDTGEEIDAYVFAAALPYSGYAYVEAFLSQKQDAWIAAHVNAYGFFGGVTRILVPDNLKTGVVKNTKIEREYDIFSDSLLSNKTECKISVDVSGIRTTVSGLLAFCLLCCSMNSLNLTVSLYYFY